MKSYPRQACEIWYEDKKNIHTQSVRNIVDKATITDMVKMCHFPVVLLQSKFALHYYFPTHTQSPCKKLFSSCKIWGFHGGDYEEWCLLGCSPWWRRRQLPPKRRFLQEPHSITTQKTPFFIFLLFVLSNNFIISAYTNIYRVKMAVMRRKVSQHTTEQTTNTSLLCWTIGRLETMNGIGIANAHDIWCHAVSCLFAVLYKW
jgi:hypothetical protein